MQVTHVPALDCSFPIGCEKDNIPVAVAAYPTSALAACGRDLQQPPSMDVVPPSPHAIQAKRKKVMVLVKAMEAIQDAAARGAAEAACAAGQAGSTCRQGTAAAAVWLDCSRGKGEGRVLLLDRNLTGKRPSSFM